MVEQRKLPFVWNLLYNGIRSVGIGTKHFAADCYQTDIYEKLVGIEQVLFEFDLSKPPSEELVHTQENIASLVAELSPEDRARVAPLMHALTQCGKITPVRIGEGGTYLFGIDGCIFQIAQRQKLPMYGLESPERQRDLCIGKWEKFSTALKTAKENPPLFALMTHPRVIKMATDKIDEVHAAYDRGDAAAVAELAKDDQDYEKFVLDRNKIQALASIPYVTSRPTAVVVGVAHVVCEPSVLDVYRMKGITVERVS
ncbi:TraB/GumN family protein [Candidatus Woesearchaeota archaeon]|nr:TraB/GumN family protein [Candidatus Woesearchaeota archaeon]